MKKDKKGTTREKHSATSSALPSSSRPAPISNRIRRTRSHDSSGTNSSSYSPPQRPSLLAGLHVSAGPDEDDDWTGGLAPPRPRRLWNVSDTNLRLLPAFYPPLDRQCSCYVQDAPPSVVAVRIAECLRRRSVSVEYDEEMATATALTIDRCRFTVHLWRAIAGRVVVVECLRQGGSVRSFHLTVEAILQAAQSLDSGDDRRTVFQASPLEYQRFCHGKRSNTHSLIPMKNNTLLSSSALESLEYVLHLLHKDRLEVQQAGLEYLVTLTDLDAVGADTAIFSSLAVLGAPISLGLKEEVEFLTDLFIDWIWGLIVERKLPSEVLEDQMRQEHELQQQHHEVSFSFASCATSLLGETETDKLEQQQQQYKVKHQGQHDDKHGAEVAPVDDYHGGLMRSLALRALANSLSILAELQPKVLGAALAVQSPKLIEAPLLEALAEDLHGATRPPSVVLGTRLASQHEAVLAARCLGLLGFYSDDAKKRIVRGDTLDLLEKARLVGKSNHAMLAEEARLAYQLLTEDERSC